MHVLYVHNSFPGQFGPISSYVAETLGWRVTFVSLAPPGKNGTFERIQYKPASGATKATHFCSRTFENNVWNTAAVYDALAARPDIRPDLIVGHSGFGSTLFLPELYPDVPVVNLFEYFYRPHHPDSDMDFRKDLGWEIPVRNYQRSRCRNAMILLDLQAATLGYTPTHFQKGCFPAEYQSKVEVIFDGIDRRVYHGHGEALRPPPAARGVRVLAGVTVSPSTRVVTYVSRGFESMRGFDIFMRAARLIARERPDTLFFVVGTDTPAYGGDENHIAPHKTFKEWVLSRKEWVDGGRWDLTKFVFTGRLSRDELARLLASTDLHIYLTVPFVLSWSLMDAMSCGAVVLASDTAPVREMVRDGENGLLASFFSPEEFAKKAIRVLDDVEGHRPLGRAAERMIETRYSLESVTPAMLRLYQQAMAPTPPVP